MKELSSVLFVWWFLMTGASSGLSTDVYTTVGPFKDKATCDHLAVWAKKQQHFNKVSECWES